jgi:hypothetical protein
LFINPSVHPSLLNPFNGIRIHYFPEIYPICLSLFTKKASSYFILTPHPNPTLYFPSPLTDLFPQPQNPPPPDAGAVTTCGATAPDVVGGISTLIVLLPKMLAAPDWLGLDL